MGRTEKFLDFLFFFSCIPGDPAAGIRSLVVLHHRLDGIFQNLAAKAEECHRT
jgi:hypothetical protein